MTSGIIILGIDPVLVLIWLGQVIQFLLTKRRWMAPEAGVGADRACLADQLMSLVAGELHLRSDPETFGRYLFAHFRLPSRVSPIGYQEVFFIGFGADGYHPTINGRQWRRTDDS